MQYLVLVCDRCGNYSAVREGARTHRCPYCGHLIETSRATIVARASSGREAREIITRLKTPPELRRRRIA